MTPILFVCVHNSGRSQMAEAFFNHLAKGQARAISAGSQPADRVNPVVVEAMREVGMDISHSTPKMLTPEMMAGVARVVTMGCAGSCPVTAVPTLDWALADPRDKPLAQVRQIRDEIEVRVRRLLAEMKAV